MNVILGKVGFLVLAFGVPSYCYARALQRAIAYACEDQNRLTPQSPWFFFMRKFKRPSILIAVGIGPWILLFLRILFPPTDMEMLLVFLGLNSVSFAAITVFAPRFKKSSIVVTALGLLTLILYLIGGYIIFSFGGDMFLYVALFGIPALGLSWLYVVFLLDREWFRFEE